MNYKEFMHTLIADKASGVYLFDSKEEYLNDTIIEEIHRKVNIPDFNLVDIKGSKTIETLKNSYETYPVMEEKKYIIWRNIDLSKSSLKDYEEILASLIEDLKDFPDYAVLLIFSDNPPFKGKFYKAVGKNGTVVKIDRLNKAELESFIGKRFVRNGKKIQKSLVASIVDRFSYLARNSEIDLYEVVNSVDKIIANSTDELVKADDVNAQLDEVLNLSIFNLTDALSEKNAKDAMTTYLNMAASNEDLFMIYHMIIREVRNLIGVKTLLASGHNDKSMMEKFGLRDFQLRKYKGNVRNFTLEELFLIHDRIFDMEVRQKSTDFDMELELTLLIKKMTQKNEQLSSTI